MGIRHGISVRKVTAIAAMVFAFGLGGCGPHSTTTALHAEMPAPPPAQAAPEPARIIGASYSSVAYQGSGGLQAMKAATAYRAGYTGAGVRIAVIDSGIALDAPAFAGRIASESSDVAGKRSIEDMAGHGTPIAAIAAGAGVDDRMMGVAFGSSLLVLRSDTPGSCESQEGCAHRDRDIARGIDLAVERGARVINLSLIGDEIEPELVAAIDRATARDVIIVLAAGNEGQDRPGRFALIADDEKVAKGRVVIVGSHDQNGNRSLFSNAAGAGADHYIMAMGEDVRSFDQQGRIWLYSGTSYAAPQVAGALALLAEAYPLMDGRALVDRLLASSIDMGAPGIDAVYGHGRLDLSQAFEMPEPLYYAANTAHPMGVISAE